MKIGIYQQPSAGLGGSELVAGVMAQAARDAGYRVEIVHHHRLELTADLVGGFFGIDLADIHFRRVASPYQLPTDRWNAVARLRPWVRRVARWDAEVTGRYDVLVANVHSPPPHNFARRGLLNVLFPMGDRCYSQITRPSNHSPYSIRERLRLWQADRSWSSRMAGYSRRIAISRFAAKWTMRYWGVRCEVLAPPVIIDPLNVPKSNAIVSLGRFTPVKQQMDILSAFLTRVAPVATDWELVFVGGLSSNPIDRDYFSRLQTVARGHRVRFIANATRSEVRAELGSARVFWHAMGLGIDELIHPDRIEHFGVATVEAMAAGCVPVVLDKGGQSEIVIPEVGYVCPNLEVMANRVVHLTHNPIIINELSAAARIRAVEFSHRRFICEFIEYLRHC